MVDKKISDLDAAGTITGSEVVPLVQSGATVKASLAVVFAAFATGPAVLAPFAITATTTAAHPVANTAYFARVSLPVKRSYRYAVFAIGTASGNVQAGLVRLSGTSQLTYTRVMDSGVIACPSAGDIRLDLTSVPLEAGDYGLFFWANNTTVTGPVGASTATRTGTRSFASVAGLTGGVPASGSLSAWNGDRTVTMLLEADI